MRAQEDPRALAQRYKAAVDALTSRLGEDGVRKVAAHEGGPAAAPTRRRACRR